MSGEEAYAQMRELLLDDGYTIVDGAYHHAVMGSWYLVVDGARPLRVVWDGRDSMLCIDERVGDGDDAFLGDWRSRVVVEPKTHAAALAALREVVAA